MSKFDYRSYNEEVGASTKETRKDQKIKHQLYERRTGRIPKKDKQTQRIARMDWLENSDD